MDQKSNDLGGKFGRGRDKNTTKQELVVDNVIFLPHAVHVPNTALCLDRILSGGVDRRKVTEHHSFRRRVVVATVCSDLYWAVTTTWGGNHQPCN